ncbi:MAG TPA: RbsD/FucU domain-containing protein [Chthoniobacter sp.]|jgi:D-ribose pyranose/furanose isomerase RbsD
MNARTFLLVLAFAAVCPFNGYAQAPWQSKLEQEIPLLGHRNWIVIADSAYPWQTAPGIETINTGATQLEVVKTVLDALGHAPHVKPIIYVDAEMQHVPEADAKGITTYRDDLSKLLAKREVQSLPHEQIIAKLDEAGKTFHVLLLKTNLTIPYTSVFLQLDCAYWNADAERRLREALEK